MYLAFLFLFLIASNNLSNSSSPSPTPDMKITPPKSCLFLLSFILSFFFFLSKQSFSFSSSFLLSSSSISQHTCQQYYYIVFLGYWKLCEIVINFKFYDCYMVGSVKADPGSTTNSWALLTTVTRADLITMRRMKRYMITKTKGSPRSHHREIYSN